MDNNIEILDPTSNNKLISRFYLIHNGDIDRKEFMINQFNVFGISYDKVNWIIYPNKEDITDKLHNKITIEPKKNSKGQSCVTYKHFLAIKDIYESNCDLGIIMEDNIQFNSNIILAIQKYLKDMPNQWDILFDSDILSDRYKLFNPKPSIHGLSVINSNKLYSPSKGANFVLINTSRCIKRLYDNFLPYKKHSDHNYNRVIKENKLVSYWAVPYNVHHRKIKKTWK